MASETKIIIRKEILDELINKPMSHKELGIVLLGMMFINKKGNNELQAIVTIGVGGKVFQCATKAIQNNGTVRPFINKFGAVFTEDKSYEGL